MCSVCVCVRVCACVCVCVCVFVFERDKERWKKYEQKIKYRSKEEKKSTEKYKAISGPKSDFYSLILNYEKKWDNAMQQKYIELSEKGEIHVKIRS